MSARTASAFHRISLHAAECHNSCSASQLDIASTNADELGPALDALIARREMILEQNVLLAKNLSILF